MNGLSRRMIWLNAYTTSSDPRVGGGFYIEAVQHLGVCPRVVILGLILVTYECLGSPLLNLPSYNLHSYLEGASTANQLIVFFGGDFWTKAS